MISKKARQGKILDAIRRQEIRSQEELSSLLRKEGIDVTQATLSRDIRDHSGDEAADVGKKSRAALGDVRVADGADTGEELDEEPVEYRWRAGDGCPTNGCF